MEIVSHVQKSTHQVVVQVEVLLIILQEPKSFSIRIFILLLIP